MSGAKGDTGNQGLRGETGATGAEGQSIRKKDFARSTPVLRVVSGSIYLKYTASGYPGSSFSTDPVQLVGSVRTRYV